MFAIHTYYTLLMKLLTSEIITLFADKLICSYLKGIEDAYMKGGDEMLFEMKELEEGVPKIVNNVQGFDLNPLAVLASKANYLIAMAEFLRYRPREGIEIPVYLADSIAVSNQLGNGQFT